MEVLFFILLNVLSTINFALCSNQTLSGRQPSVPTVTIHIPETPWESRKKKIEEPVIKEDPNEVEVFPVDEHKVYEAGVGNPNQFYPYDPYYPTGGVNPINPLIPPGRGVIPGIPTTLDAFTARRAIDHEIVAGHRIRFLDTVTQVGFGWNNLTSEFTCNAPGVFFFTFTACGERYRHFRITLKHNGIGVVSAYGDVNGYQMASNSAVLRLLIGDRVYLELAEGGIYEVTTFTGRAYNTFSGFRIL